jgi:hypothetical protein
VSAESPEADTVGVARFARTGSTVQPSSSEIMNLARDAHDRTKNAILMLSNEVTLG